MLLCGAIALGILTGLKAVFSLLTMPQGKV